MTSSVTNSAPKRSAWLRKRDISSGPAMPSGKPGKFSISNLRRGQPVLVGLRRDRCRRQRPRRDRRELAGRAVQPLGLPPRAPAVPDRSDRAWRRAGTHAPARRARPLGLLVQLPRADAHARGNARGDLHGRLPGDPGRRDRDGALLRRHARDRHASADVVLEVADLHPLRRARLARSARTGRPRHEAPAGARRHDLGRLHAAAHPRHAHRQRLGLRRGRVHDPRRLRLPHARPARHHPARHRDVDPHDRPRARRSRRGALPLLLARHGRARVGAGARRRRSVRRALLTRGVVAHRRRAGCRDHARQLGLPGRRGRHLHDAARPRPLRADVPRGRRRRRRAARAGRLDRPRAGARRRADRGVQRLALAPTRTSPAPSTTTSGGSTTARPASTRRSG